MKKIYVSPLMTEVNVEAEQMLAASLGINDQTVDTSKEGGQLGGGDVLGQGDKVGITGLFGQEERAFFAEVRRLDGKRHAAPHGAILEELRLHQLEAAVRIAQEQQAQDRHTVLIGGELGTRAEQVGRFPEVGFQFLEALVVHESPFRAMLVISSTGRHGW